MAAQAGLCPAWSETPEDTFCRAVAQLLLLPSYPLPRLSRLYYVHPNPHHPFAAHLWKKSSVLLPDH